jgi:hypothetical protein
VCHVIGSIFHCGEIIGAQNIFGLCFVGRLEGLLGINFTDGDPLFSFEKNPVANLLVDRWVVNESSLSSLTLVSLLALSRLLTVRQGVGGV